MQDLIKWTLEAIRNEGSLMSWMEERRVEWTPLLASRLKYLLDGRTFIVITDDERTWFEEYLIKKINRASSARPLLPFVSLRALYPMLDEINSKEQILLLEDMLSLAFPNGYVYFYIGKSVDKRSQIAKGADDSYMWLFDEQAQNSFYLSSNDENLDIKLITLFRLFDKSIDAVLFAKVVL
ncbi:HobA family DNA replication regulator [Campylobacter sp. RM9344]|uniref:HobA family DNA replication regulator n=1 Tax=Campylobacter californiensis TaxID=1032243 RepID=A0AAW3ZU41_9BACT|nr:MULTISPECIES: HobA family DNA replication regulator [unclassified Campylobacter]MBE2984788.1 HobA family DNA replication regulator [Campylobacter sp. RM6883]MBE2986492.1 HobA family DNA replication regulator [Campylobacter sp. RM12919]MBE2987692.1 HobA family DNA replication regulator [Campylobacter sp. RM12920]MBE2994746.1 HobA family DNA replication regulator [Campylobacter sp. RM6913]MBE3022340.1 HobA family DNA replication regulator [Campylobacter sp. 7477a]MBE3029612.1 HobA family DNA